jgi:hypothetical protein
LGCPFDRLGRGAPMGATTRGEYRIGRFFGTIMRCHSPPDTRTRGLRQRARSESAKVFKWEGRGEMKKHRPVGDARRKSGSSGPALKSPPPRIYAISITTFAPEPYELLRPLSIVIEGRTGGFIASFVEANINASGETEHEAINMVKDTILMAYERLASKDDETLGPGPLKQKQILMNVIREK